MHCARWKKPDLERFILYESIHRTFWKRQIYRDRKQISGRQGLRVMGGIDWLQRVNKKLFWSDGILYLLKEVNVVINKLYVNFKNMELTHELIR